MPSANLEVSATHTHTYKYIMSLAFILVKAATTLIMNSVCLVLIGRFPPSQGHLVEHSHAGPVSVTLVVSHQIQFHSKAVLFG